MTNEHDLPHLRATCAAIMQERRTKEAAWQAAADRERKREDWDAWMEQLTFSGKVAAILALGVFLFVAMAVL